MIGEPASFDGPSIRSTQSDHPVRDVPRALRHAAEMAGLDVVSELFNEALRYSDEGHLRLAREHLDVLLCLAPDDGEARLLFARVLVAGQRWQEALSALDEARASGADVPAQLRSTVEEHLRAERNAEEAQRAVSSAREQGEVKNLRSEARRLRSENAQLLGRTHELERETRKWAWTTAGVSTLAILFIAVNLLLSPKERATEDQLPVAAESAESAEEALVSAPTMSATDRAASVLANTPALEGSELDVVVTNGQARLSGHFITHAQKRRAVDVLAELDDVGAVDADTVTILARSKGGTHVVASGDNLSKIAYDYYGDASLSKTILKANRSTLGGRANLKIGQDLAIPPID